MLSRRLPTSNGSYGIKIIQIESCELILRKKYLNSIISRMSSLQTIQNGDASGSRTWQDLQKIFLVLPRFIIILLNWIGDRFIEIGHRMHSRFENFHYLRVNLPRDEEKSGTFYVMCHINMKLLWWLVYKSIERYKYK